eukprot:1155264-Pelagomonas_calceolata.AAC.4
MTAILRSLNFSNTEPHCDQESVRRSNYARLLAIANLKTFEISAKAYRDRGHRDTLVGGGAGGGSSCSRRGYQCRACRGIRLAAATSAEATSARPAGGSALAR